MAFNMKGSPAKMGTISGTAGHASALKQVNRDGSVSIPALENLKKKEGKPHVSKKGEKMAGDKAWKKASEKSMKSTGDNLNNLIKTRSGQKKGSDEYNTTQNKINAAMGNKKVHKTKLNSQSKETQAKKAVIDTKTKEKQSKIVTKAEDKAKKDDSSNFKTDYKAERKLVKTEQKKSRKKANLDVKEARKASGRGSDEVKAAKAARKANRKANRAERKQMRKDQKENKAVNKGKLPEYALVNKKDSPADMYKK
jgi:hypothetical protein